MGGGGGGNGRIWKVGGRRRGLRTLVGLNLGEYRRHIFLSSRGAVGWKSKHCRFPLWYVLFCDTGILKHIIIDSVKGVYTVSNTQAHILDTHKNKGIFTVSGS